MTAPLSDSLVDLFCRLAAAISPPGRERPCADIARAYLRDLGLSVEEDDAGILLGGDTGNLYCGVRPTQPGGIALFLCAHLDTVPPDGPVEPVQVDGYLVNAQPTILGADNKAAVAVMLDAIRMVVEQQVPHAGLELVLTVREEQGLRGAKHFDLARLRAGNGFVFDHPGAIGGMVLAAPSRTVIEAEVVGRAAHAGIDPQDGRNAIIAASAALARLAAVPDPVGTSTNVGVISGGSAANVVAERCTVTIEVRSLDDARCRARAAEIAALIEATARAYACLATIHIGEQYHAYQLAPTALPVQIASAALRRCGFQPVALETGGGADAHVFSAGGRACLNLAHGVDHFHSPDERVSVRALHDMRDVTLALIDVAARMDTGWKGR
jgi:tripeptide aminopeptidase